jgi:hypothetical protein
LAEKIVPEDTITEQGKDVSIASEAFYRTTVNLDWKNLPETHKASHYLKQNKLAHLHL